MRKLFLSLVMAVGFGGAVLAQGSDIKATIGAQIEAFESDDVTRAFTFASPNIQKLFQTPETFGSMVRNGYPMVWRPAEVRFLELREIAGSLWQKVMITDRRGVVHILDYQMVELDSGWKINGVQILDAGDANV